MKCKYCDKDVDNYSEHVSQFHEAMEGYQDEIKNMSDKDQHDLVSAFDGDTQKARQSVQDTVGENDINNDTGEIGNSGTYISDKEEDHLDIGADDEEYMKEINEGTDPNTTDADQCIVCGRGTSDHSNPSTDYRGMRGDSPETDHYFEGGKMNGSDDHLYFTDKKGGFAGYPNDPDEKVDYFNGDPYGVVESKANEDTTFAGDEPDKIYHFSCNICSHSTNSDTPITSCYNCGNTDETEIMRDTTFESRLGESFAKEDHILKAKIKKLERFINMASMENPMNLGKEIEELANLKNELASTIGVEVEDIWEDIEKEGELDGKSKKEWIDDRMKQLTGSEKDDLITPIDYAMKEDTTGEPSYADGVEVDQIVASPELQRTMNDALGSSNPNLDPAGEADRYPQKDHGNIDEWEKELEDLKKEIGAESDDDDNEEFMSGDPDETASDIYEMTHDPDNPDTKKEGDEMWSRKPYYQKIETFENLGFKQGDAIKMANITWYEYTTEVRKALEIEEEEKSEKRDDSQNAFDDGSDVPQMQVDSDSIDYNIIGESQTSRTNYECEHCNSGFKNNESLIIHYNDIHAKSFESGGCFICGESNSHMVEHLAYEHGYIAKEIKKKSLEVSNSYSDIGGEKRKVTFTDNSGNERTGNAVMKGPAGWVINSGNQARPDLVDESNFISVESYKCGSCDKEFEDEDKQFDHEETHEEKDFWVNEKVKGNEDVNTNNLWGDFDDEDQSAMADGLADLQYDDSPDSDWCRTCGKNINRHDNVNHIFQGESKANEDEWDDLQNKQKKKLKKEFGDFADEGIVKDLDEIFDRYEDGIPDDVEAVYEELIGRGYAPQTVRDELSYSGADVSGLESKASEDFFDDGVEAMKYKLVYTTGEDYGFQTNSKKEAEDTVNEWNSSFSGEPIKYITQESIAIEDDPDFKKDPDYQGYVGDDQVEPSQYTQSGMDHDDPSRGDTDFDALEKAGESIVSWDVDGNTSQTNADWQFGQLIPIYNGKMKASFKSTQTGEFSFMADFSNKNDAEEWADNLKSMDDLGVKNISVESIAKEHAWQCDECGMNLADGEAANQHQKETGHYDMGFATVLSGDSKWDKLSGEGGVGSGPQKDSALEPEQVAMKNINPDYNPYSKDEGNPYTSPMTEAKVDEDETCDNCGDMEDLNEDGLCDYCHNESGINQKESERDAWD